MTAATSPPVMADVAARAGVSLMTVSRVLNGFSGVRPETKERVEAAVAALGYRANVAARTLAGGRAQRVGVVSTDTSYFGPSSTLFGIEAAARARDHAVSFATLRAVNDAEMRDSLANLGDAHVDGAIVIAPSRAAVAALPTDGVGYPLVVISGAELAGRCTVAVDQTAGARLAASHLLDLGHDTVHHVRGPRGWLDADARETGWKAELRARSIKPAKALVGDWSARSGYRLGARLAADPEVHAIFVANDQMAVGVLLALTEAGRRVPDDVSVVGYDNIPESEFLAPPLTTVWQDFNALGREAVDLLLRLAAGEATATHVTVAPQLVVRSSSGSS